MTEDTEQKDTTGAVASAATPTAPSTPAGEGRTEEQAEAAAVADGSKVAEVPKRKMRMLTDGVDHKAGEVLEFDNEKAVELIHGGLAESAE